MKKKKGFFTSLAILSLLGLSMSANAVMTVTNYNAPKLRLKRGDQKHRVVMDFSLTTQVACQVNDIVFENTGTAKLGAVLDIAGIKVWYEDDDTSGLSGDDHEVLVGAITWNYQGAGDLKVHIPVLAGELPLSTTGKRIYVTVGDIADTPGAEGKTVIMKVPKLLDGVPTGDWTNGDYGIFVSNAEDGPANDIVNAFTQTIDPVLGYGNNHAPAGTFPVDIFDAADTNFLVMDFTLTGTNPCNVNAITFRNVFVGSDSATTSDVTVKFWYESGFAPDFQEESDSLVGTAIAYSSGDLPGKPDKNWYLVGLTKPDIAGGKRCYVTVTLKETSLQGRKIKMQVPEIQDTQNANGLFNLGEVGIFTSNTEDGPLTAITNANIQELDAKRPTVHNGIYYHDFDNDPLTDDPLLKLTFSETIYHNTAWGIDTILDDKIRLSNAVSGGDSIILTQTEFDNTTTGNNPTELFFDISNLHKDTIALWRGQGYVNLYVRIDTAAVRDLVRNRAFPHYKTLTWIPGTDEPVLDDISWVSADTLNTAFGVGDTLVFNFSQSMLKSTITSTTVNNRLKIKRTGGQYGTSPTVFWDATGDTCFVILSTGFNIVDKDEVNPSNEVKNLGGIPDNTTAPLPKIEDNTGPLLISIDFVNNDGPSDTKLSAGDQLVFSFSEKMKDITITRSTANAQLPTSTDGVNPNGHTYDCDAVGRFAWSTDKKSCTITLGPFFNVVSKKVGGDSVLMAIGSTVKDFYDNPVDFAHNVAILETAKPIFIRVETWQDPDATPMDTTTTKVRVVCSEDLFGDDHLVVWKVAGANPTSVTMPLGEDTVRILEAATRFGSGGTPLVEHLFGVTYKDESGNYLGAYSANAVDKIAPYFTAVTSEPAGSTVTVIFQESVSGANRTVDWIAGGDYPDSVTSSGTTRKLWGVVVGAISTQVQYIPDDNYKDANNNYVRPDIIDAKPGSAIDWVDITLKTGWNMVSVPVTPTDPSVGAVFPNIAAISTWDPGAVDYIIPTTIEKEKGYWVAWARADTIMRVEGTLVSSYTTPLTTGWSMIGSVKNAVPIASVTFVPDNYIANTLTGWNGTAYVVENTIVPTCGYWVAVSGNCNMTVQTTKGGWPVTDKEIIESSSLFWDVNLKVENEGTEHTLKLGVASDATPGFDRGFDKLLPPPPPSGKDKAFDAHFEIEPGFTGCVTDVRNPEATEWNIVVNSSATISWNPSAIPEDMVFTISAGDKSFDMSSKDHFTTDNPSTIKIVTSKRPAAPKVFALSQNTPNPFTGNTTIKFQIPVPAHTSLTIYNMAGQSIRTLVNENLDPGYYALSWNGRDNSGAKVGNGVYFCKLQAGKSTAVRKIMLME